MCKCVVMLFSNRTVLRPCRRHMLVFGASIVIDAVASRRFRGSGHLHCPRQRVAGYGGHEQGSGLVGGEGRADRRCVAPFQERT